MINFHDGFEAGGSGSGVSPIGQPWGPTPHAPTKGKHPEPVCSGKDEQSSGETPSPAVPVKLDTSNRFMVGLTGDMIVILVRVPARVPVDASLNLFAWMAVLADPGGKRFADVVRDIGNMGSTGALPSYCRFTVARADFDGVESIVFLPPLVQHLTKWDAVTVSAQGVVQADPGLEKFNRIRREIENT